MYNITCFYFTSKSMKINRYEDKYFYYFWKTNGIPSTYGNQKCFLDYLIESDDKDIQSIILAQKEFFSQQEEYGLVNRLDNDTTWLLYMAKTPLFKQKYKQLQSEWKIKKYYVADVYWKIENKTQKIVYPITHHKYQKDRMVVFLNTKQTGKIDQKKLKYVQTDVELLYYDPEKNISTLWVQISKWMRHQIRAHLASIWYPIVWEKIYIKKPSNENLHLYSVGVDMDI